jgi:hypothetical protein
MVGGAVILPERLPDHFREALPRTRDWYRVVPSRFPPVQLWDRLASREELNAVAAIESVTNARLAEGLGEIYRVPKHDWIFGPGTSPIMAAFCHPAPQGSRFSPGDYGVYYAAESVDAAATEVAYHRRRWFVDNRIAPRTDTYRCYVGSVAKSLVDIRGEPEPRVLHDPTTWQASRSFGNQCRHDGRWGIHFSSVRAEGAECVALLRPPASTPVIQSCHLKMEWDGERISPWKMV